MESHTTPQKTQTPSDDSSLEDAPLLNLLSQSYNDLSPEELRERVMTLREISSSPMTLKRQLSNKKAEERASKKGPAKATGASLAHKYKNLGK